MQLKNYTIVRSLGIHAVMHLGPVCMHYDRILANGTTNTELSTSRQGCTTNVLILQ